jgi:hypothetical protein
LFYILYSSFIFIYLFLIVFIYLFVLFIYFYFISYFMFIYFIFYFFIYFYLFIFISFLSFIYFFPTFKQFGIYYQNAFYLPTNAQQPTTHVNNNKSCKYSLNVPDNERKYRSKHVEQPRTINYPTQLHLVGHFRKL